jgi:hypothetical protein
LSTLVKILKWLLIAGGVGCLIYIGVFLWAFTVYSNSFLGEFHSKQELIDNYNVKEKEINDVKKYITTIVPFNKAVDIEFDGNRKLSIFHLIDNGTFDSNWDLKISSKKTDTLLKKLGWTKATLSTLKGKLNRANCISVKSGDPCIIGWQRSGMGKYFYNIFDIPISDSLRKTYNDSCLYISITIKLF